METALPMHNCKLCLRARAAEALVELAGGAAAGTVEAGRGFESRGAHRPRGGKIRFLRQMARVGNRTRGQGCGGKRRSTEAVPKSLLGQASTQTVGRERGGKQRALATKALVSVASAFVASLAVPTFHRFPCCLLPGAKHAAGATNA